MTLELVAEAVAAGACESKACSVVGVSSRTLTRWKARLADLRRGPKRPPPNKLTDEERVAILRVVNSEKYRELSPNQIVPLLADSGIYLASERTIYRLLRAENQLRHRQRCRPRASAIPKAHVASAPNQVWSWDITYLRSMVRGAFFFLYLVVDVFSRKIVGWSVHEEERADRASELIEYACEHEGVSPGALVLHADNGGPMKGSTMLATLQRLGVAASFSRPSVSDDNPYSEALFRTVKYHRSYPSRPFERVEDARTWVASFVAWYNNEHLHSALRFVSPCVRHAQGDRRLLSRRHHVYVDARARTPQRWARNTRNWAPIGRVYLNHAKAGQRHSALPTHVS